MKTTRLLAATVALALTALRAAESSSQKNPWMILPPTDPNVVGRAPESPPPRTPDKKSPAASAESASWTTDYAAALERAAAEHKQVLLNFTGSDWCSWCHKLEADVFSKPEFQTRAAARFVLVTVDFPQKKRLPAAEVAQNSRLQQQFKVNGYPTIVVVDPAGKKLAELVGYVRGGPKAFFAALDKQAKN